MEAAVPPWASERGWDRVGHATGSGFPIAPSAHVRTARPKPSMSANPWEGVLGPSAIESAMTTKTHARADVSTLIKTPKEVWKAGKQPTEVTSAPLPGTNAERAAAKRTPSHLRGNEKASRGVVAAHERLPDAATIKVTKAVWKTEEKKYSDGTIMSGTTILTVRPKRTMIPASSMSAASLAALDDSRELPERAQSASAILEDTEFNRSNRRPETEAEMQAFIRDLKAQFTKLQQTATSKSAELERLHAARERSDRNEAQVWDADKDFEDFKQRIDARNTAIDDRLPDLSKQKHELEEVVKRLNKANKTMNNRLGQCREELRVYHGEIRDMNILLKEVEAARNDMQSQLEKMKTSVKEDAKKRNEDLSRRQARVQKMLAETKEQAERLKEIHKREEEEHMARQAEEDLARQRAFDHGTSFGLELRRIRENVHGPEAPENPLAPQEEESQLAAAMKKIMHAAHSSDVEEAMAFWSKQQARKSSLEALAQDLTARVERLSQEALDPGRELGQVENIVAMPGGEDNAVAMDERKDLEEAVQDIELFADQNRVVNEAMRERLQSYVAWAGAVYQKMVRASEDDTLLRVCHKLARRMPSASDDEDRLAMWCSDSLVTLQNALTAKVLEVQRSQAQSHHGGAGGGGGGWEGVPRGPDTGPRITAISSKQTLLVSSRGTQGPAQMETL